MPCLMRDRVSFATLDLSGKFVAVVSKWLVCQGVLKQRGA
jgi:hypothetical protein